MLGFEPGIFNYAIYELVEPEKVELDPHFATPDPLICQLGLTLKAELESDGLGSKLYAETIASLLAVHLLQHYSIQKPVSEALQPASLRLELPTLANRDGFIRPRSFPLHQPMPLPSSDDFGLTQPP